MKNKLLVILGVTFCLVVMLMAGKAEQRSFGRQTGAKIELVEPPNFERHLDYDARLNLDYIKAHPESGITIKKGGK